MATKEEQLEALKIEADSLGVKFKDNVTLNTLSKALKRFKEPVSDIDSLRAKVKVQVSCNDPKLSDYTTTPFTSVSNAVYDAKINVIPLNVPWNVSRLVVDTLKAMTYVRVVQEKGTKGKLIERRESRPKYNVVELDGLTPKELEQLASEQRGRGK